MFNDNKDIIATSKKLESKNQEQKLLKIDDLVDNKYIKIYENLLKNKLIIKYIYKILNRGEV